MSVGAAGHGQSRVVAGQPSPPCPSPREGEGQGVRGPELTLLMPWSGLGVRQDVALRFEYNGTTIDRKGWFKMGTFSLTVQR